MEHQLVLLADASLRSLIVAAAAFAASWRRPAAFRHAVWSSALICMLLMPAMTALLPELPIAVWPASQPAPVPSIDLPAAMPAGQPGPALPVSKPWWPQAMVWVYAGVAALFAARVALAYAMAARLVRRSTQVLDFRALRFADGCEVYESEAARVPVTVGPRIVLPRAWREWDDACVAAALAHEAAHVRRHDWWIALAAAVNRCVFWFHPLAWWLERNLSNLAEQAADDASLLATGDRRAYARLLVNMAQAVQQGGRRMAWEALAMARPSGVSRRVEAALDERRKLSAGVGRARAAAVLACAVVLGTVAASARLVAQQARAEQVMRFGIPANPQRQTAERVSELEAQVAANSDDFTARQALIMHYNSAGDREAWKRHLIAYIERWPESAWLSSPTFRVMVQLPRMADASDYAELRQVWDRMLQQRPDDPRVAFNAALTMRYAGAYQDAAALLRKVQEREPENRRISSVELVDVYVDAIVAGEGRPVGFAQEARRELLASSDPTALLTAGSRLEQWMMMHPGTSSTLEPLAKSISECLRELGVELQQGGARMPARGVGGGVAGGVGGGVRTGVAAGVAGGVPGGVRTGAMAGAPQGIAGGLPGGIRDPNTGIVTAAPAPVIAQAVEAFPPPPEGVQRIRVGGAIQAVRLEHHENPEYPPLARQARVQGVVRFNALIGADGYIRDLTLTSGHPLLVPAAQQAVRRWKYQVTLLNGQPVEVITTIDIPFSLDDTDI